jgi:isoleucyl-tRNA synthetase
LRKEQGLEVLDKISIEVEKDGEAVTDALTTFKDYISTETQAYTLELKDTLANATSVDMDEFVLKIRIEVVNR